MESFVIGPLSFVLSWNADDTDFQTQILTDYFCYKDGRANAPFLIGRDRIGYKDCRASAPEDQFTADAIVYLNFPDAYLNFPDVNMITTVLYMKTVVEIYELLDPIFEI